MVNFIEVLEGIGCFGFWDVGKFVHVNLERIWHLLSWVNAKDIKQSLRQCVDDSLI